MEVEEPYGEAEADIICDCFAHGFEDDQAAADRFAALVAELDDKISGAPSRVHTTELTLGAMGRKIDPPDPPPPPAPVTPPNRGQMTPANDDNRYKFLGNVASDASGWLECATHSRRP